MLEFSAGVTSSSHRQKPSKPPPKMAVPPKRRPEQPESKNTAPKSAVPRKSQATTRKVTPVGAGSRDSGIDKRPRFTTGRTSSSGRQLPESATSSPTHKRVSPPSGNNNKKVVPPAAKSVIPRTKSPAAATTRRVTPVVRDSNVEKSSAVRTSSFREQKTSPKSAKPSIVPVKESEGDKEAVESESVVPHKKPQAQAITRRVPSDSSISSGDDSDTHKHLPNEDLYIGCFSDDLPHGPGKYLWKDGRMYEGEWNRGKVTGNGIFCWPSGSSYEGEFKSGRIEGFGTFINPQGDVYRGSWSGDKKHGHGVMYYSNGDYYDGDWRSNLQDGEGRYVCKNGIEYSGGWKNGTINGRGILTLSNGNKCEGSWEKGVPVGHGIFTWPDGTRLARSWVRNDNGYQVFKEDTIMMDLGFTAWTSDADAGDIDVDTLEAFMMHRDRSVFKRDDSMMRDCRNRPCSFSGELNMPGMTILKGHKNYDLMCNLQLGIWHSVEHDSTRIRELKQSDYDPKEKFWTRYPFEDYCHLPKSTMPFRWKDYCPMVFRHLRQLFRVDADDYKHAICGSGALRGFSSPGKSGSSFYLTQDDRFMIKTVKKSEVKVLIKMLQSYHDHMQCYPNSLVTKFYGLHCVKPVGGAKTRFVVMGNLFCSEYRIQRRFDLKGSSHGRFTDKAEGEIDETTTLKDLDLNYAFRVHEHSHQDLIKQIQRDCEFLEAENIMDYSFLVGIHFCDDNMGSSPFVMKTGKAVSYQNEKLMYSGRFLDRARSGLGANMPARAERLARKSDFGQYTPGGEIYDVVLYFGIIDILQDYDISKKLEHAYKSLQVDSTSISAVDPRLYSKRFQDFIGRIFLPDTRQQVRKGLYKFSRDKYKCSSEFI